ncbi:hypothetical protein T01_13592 [Trichinella spiralis]|uniref:Uncharacterized protein n=1 Tax=Trichinella spiralis TaxID=6334 RepID=A0A0V1BVQ7_TRISP|nr:hypothetical protein T01_13592 [Trichinella spiralis]
MWQRAAGFLSAVMSPDPAQAKRQALLRNFTSSSISSSTGSSSEKGHLQHASPSKLQYGK